MKDPEKNVPVRFVPGEGIPQHAAHSGGCDTRLLSIGHAHHPAPQEGRSFYEVCGGEHDLPEPVVVHDRVAYRTVVPVEIPPSQDA